MRCLRLPNGNLLILAECEAADDTDAGDRLHEIGPDHPDYGRWLAFGGRRGPESGQSATLTR